MAKRPKRKTRKQKIEEARLKKLEERVENLEQVNDVVLVETKPEGRPKRDFIGMKKEP